MFDQFQKVDEFYNFKDIFFKINVVFIIDELIYEGGKNGEGYLMSWYQEYDGGCFFYIVMGYINESFLELIFFEYLWQGICYVSGGDSL